MSRAGLLLAVAVLLAACAGPPLYQPVSSPHSFGYAERKFGDSGLYEVSYRAPARTTYAYYATDRESDRRLRLAYDLALLRAAELALSRANRPAFFIRRRDNDVEVDIRRGHGASYGGFGRYPRYTAIPYSRYDDPPYAVISAQVTLLVEFTAARTRGSFDAAETASRLRRQYGAELPP